MLRTAKTVFTHTLVSVVLVLSVTFHVFAQSSSTNYKLEESYFGTGGEVDATSSNYRSQQSAGALGVGRYSSTSYDLEAGFVTQNQPFLEMVVTTTTLDLGELSDTSASYGSPTGGVCGCSFYIRTYLSSNYVVYNASSQPATSESGAFLAPKTTQAVPSTDPTVEEFGFNLVANTSPASFGANPANDPDDSFADGKASTGYEVTNQFKFVAGDVVAESAATATNPAIGQTNYTISYIAKKKTTTSAGLYTLNHDLVVVATY